MNLTRINQARTVQLAPQRRAERGQAIVEFALVMPILILLLFGVVFFAMAFNLQMVLNAAVREGARAWASNRANTSPCCATCTTSPCDPTFGESGFQKNVVPIVVQYITDNGYDAASNIVFEVIQVSQSELSAAEWNQIQDGAEDATKVKLVISYRFYLPTPFFEIELINLRAESTFKKGS
jgi:uncharacterized protein (UPF0333 family)